MTGNTITILIETANRTMPVSSSASLLKMPPDEQREAILTIGKAFFPTEKVITYSLPTESLHWMVTINVRGVVTSGSGKTKVDAFETAAQSALDKLLGPNQRLVHISHAARELLAALGGHTNTSSSIIHGRAVLMQRELLIKCLSADDDYVVV